MGPTALLPLQRKACWEFFRPKNPTALPGCEPANLGTKGQHATSTPPKPLTSRLLSKQFHVSQFLIHNDFKLKQEVLQVTDPRLHHVHYVNAADNPKTQVHFLPEP